MCIQFATVLNLIIVFFPTLCQLIYLWGVVWDFYSFDCILGCCLGGMYFKTQVLVAFIMFTFAKKRS